MSAVAGRLPLADAIAEAQTFRSLFDPDYLQWEFAGSLRRNRPDVGDIEHVVLPARPTDMFGCPDGDGSHSVRWRARVLLNRRRVRLHNYGGQTRFGPRYMGFDFRGRLHEVFCARPDNWGVILAIRTGSADFSRDLMIRLRHRGFRVSGGRLWRVIDAVIAAQHQAAALLDDDTWGEPIDCPDETTLFAAAGHAAVIPPEDRK